MPSNALAISGARRRGDPSPRTWTTALRTRGSGSSTVHSSDFDDVTDLAPPIRVDEAFALDRPNPARNAEGSFVFGVDDEVGLPRAGVLGDEREDEGHGPAREALSAK